MTLLESLMPSYDVRTAARRRFGLYWMVVRPFSGLIRRDWLRAIKRLAERDDTLTLRETDQQR